MNQDLKLGDRCFIKWIKSSLEKILNIANHTKVTLQFIATYYIFQNVTFIKFKNNTGY